MTVWGAVDFKILDTLWNAVVESTTWVHLVSM